MVSFDVVSLFTYIPLDLAKQCTEDLLKSCDTDDPAIALLELLDLCMETTFSFDQQYYQQLKRVPMGSPISGFLVDITMQKLEATALRLAIVDVELVLHATTLNQHYYLPVVISVCKNTADFKSVCVHTAS
nr:unnamed protein product [Spirometra erinaceieuropaei]